MENKNPKIVFMGTPDFAVPSLEALVKAGFEVGYVVTKPDAVRDRGKKIKFSDVKEKARELSIDVLQPEKIKDNKDFIKTLKDYAPDYIVTAAYGKILPVEVLDIPKKGAINVHGSLLPRFRGAAPIQWSILSGDKNAGVTIMYMAEGMDTGDMIAKVSTPIDKKNCEELYDELSEKGGQLLVKTIEKMEEGKVEAEKQDESKATYAPTISKKDGEIDFNKSAQEIERMTRAFYPWPGTFTHYQDKLIKVWQADALPGTNDSKKAASGTILEANDEGISVACSQGVLRITMLQAPGKKKMKTADFLRGNNIEKQAVLR